MVGKRVLLSFILGEPFFNIAYCTLVNNVHSIRNTDEPVLE
jgi:hypothetical protein